MTNHPANILTIENLSVSFSGAAAGVRVDVSALADVSLSVAAGEAVAVVGESGSGKSTLLRSVMRQLPQDTVVQASKLTFDGYDLLTLPEKSMRTLRGSSLGFLFQNGLQSLDALFTIDAQFDEVLRVHDAVRRAARRAGARHDTGAAHTLETTHRQTRAERKHAYQQIKLETLARTGIDDPERILAAIPSQLSGGQCQRVALALALAGRPKLLLADEPTSALDAEAQRLVGTLLAGLNQDDGMALLVVTHNIEFAAAIATQIVVMRAGHIVEQGSIAQILENPQHPYTRELIDAIPHASRTFRVVWSADSAEEDAHE